MDENLGAVPAASESTIPPVIDPDKEKDARLWAMLCHLSALSGYITLVGWLVGPLIVWLVNKDQYPLVDDQGKESLNFQISVLIYALVCTPLIFCLIGVPLLAALGVAHVILVIIAGLKAYGGEAYRYPLTIRLFK